MHCEEHSDNSSIPDVEDSIMASENQNKNGDAAIKELSAGCLFRFSKSCIYITHLSRFVKFSFDILLYTLEHGILLF